MKLNNELLRARRLELGMTLRSVARDTTMSLALIQRLEETGDADVLVVSALERLLRTLSLDLVDVIENPPATGTDDDYVTGVCGLLQERGRSVPSHDIASTLGITMDQVNSALSIVDERLRTVGLRLNLSSSGWRIVAVARRELGSTTNRERARYLSNLNHGDMALLYRVATGKVFAKTAASSNNGNVSVSKLKGAGLVEIVNEVLKPTTRAHKALFGDGAS